ncbi:hypothetical protein [Jiangella gansuensis]|uniref:hypothetical protein n=1 Tax=Jiangella gansuensis TaxID=281473 RepID=UPI00047BFEC0|nr:hypothetical protein [Jiangella gansuensis]
MSICDVPVIAEVCNLGGDVAGVMVAAPFEWLASAAGHAAAMMFENVWAVFDTTTLVDLTPEQYIAVYNIVFGIAIVVMLVFSFLQLGTGLIRRDADALQHPVPGLAKSVLGSFLVVTSTATLLEIVDQLCIGIVEPTGTTMEQMGDRIAALALGLTAITFATPGVGAIIVLILGGIVTPSRSASSASDTTGPRGSRGAPTASASPSVSAPISRSMTATCARPAKPGPDGPKNPGNEHEVSNLCRVATPPSYEKDSGHGL